MLATVGPGVLFRLGHFLLLGQLGGFLLMALFPGAVFAVIAREIPHVAVSREHKRVVHGTVHEEAVVAHDDDAAVELRQVFLEDFQRGDVQVVGRLVKDEEIGLGHQHHGQIEPAAFATAQLGDVLLLVLRREQEVVEPGHGGIVVFLVKIDVFRHIAHGINHAFALVKVHPFLAVMGKFHRLADFEVAAVGLDDVEQQFDERGLAHTVVTHDAQLLVAGKRVVEIVQDHLVTVALVHMVGREDFLADVGALHVQFHLPVVAALLGAFLQVIEGVDAVLCLVGACLRLAAHPVQLGAQQVAGPFHLGILGLDALGALFQVVVVVAAVGEDAVLVHLQDAVADVVQEVAVVGHHQQGHTAALQVVLQPLDHVDVEVVGGLVQDEHLRLIDEQAGQRHTLDLASAQFLDRLVVVGDLELGENLLEAFLIVPCHIGIHRLDGCCHGIAVAGAQGLLIGMNGSRARVVAMQARVEHGVRPAQVGQLRQVTHAQVVAVDDRAAVL